MEQCSLSFFLHVSEDYLMMSLLESVALSEVYGSTHILLLEQYRGTR